MNKEDTPIKVKYKWNNGDKYGDLVCELTDFMDTYLLDNKKEHTLFRTYLYNDIGVYSSPKYLQIAFRVPRSNTWWNIIKKIR